MYHHSDRARAQRPLWRNPDFLLLWSGQVISMLGTSISQLALPLLMLAITHSPAQAGLLAATRQAPYLLFSLPAGALIDRWNRKAVMIYCDIARWLALGSVPLAFALDHLSIAHLYIVGFIEGTAHVLFSLAQIAALPRVVTEEQVPQAYALDTATENVGILLGPALGAFIIGLTPAVVLGPVLAYLVDSISYLVSLLSLLFIRARFQSERARPAHSHLWHDILEGARFLWQQPLLRIMAFLTAAVNFLQSPLLLTVIILARDTLKLDVFTLGLILSTSGIGGILGAVVSPWLQTRLRFGLLLIGPVMLWTVAVALLALASWTPLLIVGYGLISLFWPIYGVAVVSYRLKLTPDALQGRVTSAFRFLTYGSEPVGATVGGLLLTVFDARIVLSLIAGGLALCALAASGTRLRKMARAE